MSHGIRWLILLLVAAMILFGRGLWIDYYADDFQFVYDSDSPGPLHYFGHENPHNSFYRPIQAAYLAVVQRAGGLDTFPIHLMQILMHALLSWLVYLGMLRLSFTRTQAGLGSLFMLASQASVHAVLSNDTLSQVGSALFGTAAVLVLFVAPGKGAHRGGVRSANRTVLLISLLLFTLGLLSKESGVAYLAILLVALAVIEWRDQGRIRLLGFLYRSIPFVLVTVAYLIIRSQIVDSQLTVGPERYQLNFGINIIKNLLMFLAAASIPFSTVDVFIAVAERNRALLGLVALTTSLLLGLTALGLWRLRDRWRLFLLLGAFGMISLFPVFLLNKTSELYVYNAMPFFAVIVGSGLGALLSGSRAKPIVRNSLLAFLAVVLAVQIASIQSKISYMLETAGRATWLVAQISSQVGHVPLGGTLVLVNPPPDTPEYSVFVMNGFNALRDGLFRINQVSGRNDFDVRIASEEEATSLIEAHRAEVSLLTLRQETVVPFESPEGQRPGGLPMATHPPPERSAKH